MKPILILNTGGIFSSVPGAHGLAPCLSARALEGSLGESGTDIIFKDAMALDSANITPK